MADGSLARHARAQLTRVVVVFSVVALLPAIALAEWARAGAGRRVARHGIRGIGRICRVRFETRGAERLDATGSYILVPNHSSPLDIPAMLLACDEVRFLAAVELFRVPLLSLAMRALGTEPIDRHDTKTAYRQLSELAGRGAPLSLAIFAEGGIAPVGQHLAFKNGAFVLAIATGASIVPVAIHHAGDLLPPGAKLAVRPGTVTVEILDPISTCGLTVQDRGALRDRVRAAVMSRLESAVPNPLATSTTTYEDVEVISEAIPTSPHGLPPHGARGLPAQRSANPTRAWIC